MGFIQSPDCTEGFLTLPGKSCDYVEQVAEFRVLYSAVDGFKGSKKFKTIIAAVKFITDNWSNGGVSDDGVQRYDGAQYKVAGSKTWFNFSPCVKSLSPAS